MTSAQGEQDMKGMKLITIMGQNYPIVSLYIWVPPSSFTSKQDEYYQHNVMNIAELYLLPFTNSMMNIASVPPLIFTMNIYCFVQLQ